MLKLQRATIEDIKILSEIEGLTKNSKTYCGRYTKKDISDYIKNSVVHIINKNGKTIGSVSYEIKNKNHVEIDGLIIKPYYRKQGFGKRAMLELLKELDSFSRIELVVHPENKVAISLYKSLGFLLESRKENFFGDGEPRLVMFLNGART